MNNPGWPLYGSPGAAPVNRYPNPQYGPQYQAPVYTPPAPFVLPEEYELIIRKMEEKDIKKVSEIHGVAFGRPWDQDSIKEEMKNDLAHYVIIKAGKYIVAYGGVWIFAGEAHIMNVAVREGAKRKGFGRMVMQTLIQHAIDKKVYRAFLEVKTDNAGAIALYESLGFQIIGTTKKYYKNNEDAYTMYSNDIRLLQKAGEEK